MQAVNQELPPQAINELIFEGFLGKSQMICNSHAGDAIFQLCRIAVAKQIIAFASLPIRVG